jgi:hypothetical protein
VIPRDRIYSHPVNPHQSRSKYENMKISVYSSVHGLKDAWDLGARGLSDCVEGRGRD